MRDALQAEDGPLVRRLRQFVLLILAIGMIGTAMDLLLIDHYEDGWQAPPLVLIAVALVVVAAVWMRAGWIGVTALRVTMALFIASGMLGVVDANTAPEKALLGMPHMTPAIVKGLIEKRPFASITDLNAYLLSQKLTQQQALDFYGKAFIHINLNTATPEEILLVPGAGKRMVREFDEYRPWKSYAQFDKEIGKYVG